MLECKGGREISHLKNCSMVFVASEGEALKVRGGSGEGERNCFFVLGEAVLLI